MAGRIEILKLVAPCLLILVALQLFGTKTSVSAESNLRDVYADYFQMDDGDYMEMDYFDERLDASEIDRHGSKHRRFKLRNKHKQKKYNYGAPSQYGPANYYQSPTPHKRPLDSKYGVPKTQSIVTPPKYRAPHRPPTRHQAAILAASRPSGSRYPVSRPLAHHSPAPHSHASHSSRLAASRPSASQLPISRPTPSRPTPSRPTPSRPSTPRPTPPRNTTSSPKPSRSSSTPSSQTFSHFELPLLPLSHPVLFGPNGVRRQTSRAKVSQSPTKSSSSSRPPTKRSSTVRPSTSQTPASYPSTTTTLAPSTTVYSSPTSSTTTSSSTYSSTPTSSESTSPTYVPTTAIVTEPSTPNAKKSQSKKKSTVSTSSKPENGTLKLTQEIPIKPDDTPKATSLSSASVSNKDDTGYFFRPTDSFPNFFKQLLQG